MMVRARLEVGRNTDPIGHSGSFGSFTASQAWHQCQDSRSLAWRAASSADQQNLVIAAKRQGNALYVRSGEPACSRY